jgi:hypothetical protein
MTGATQRCPDCGTPTPSGARCARCAALVPDPCPCCGGQAGASPDAELRYVCNLCGGPRIPGARAGSPLGAQTAALLKTADSARKARAGWRILALADGFFLPVSLALTAAFAAFGGAIIALITALVLVAPVAAVLAFAVRRSRARGREIAPALDAAWLAAARAVAEALPVGETANAATLAAAFGIDEAKAEELSALLEVEPVAPRMRIGAPVSVEPIDEAARAEADAVAEAERALAHGGVGRSNP